MTPAGFPHSDILGSTSARDSPGLNAACHVLHRLLAPRHPPRALCSLTPPASDQVISDGSGFGIHLEFTRRNRRFDIYCRTTYPVVKVRPTLVGLSPQPSEPGRDVQRSAGRWPDPLGARTRIRGS